jgi:hypothetical protein
MEFGRLEAQFLKESRGNQRKSLRAFDGVGRLVCWWVRMECSRYPLGRKEKGYKYLLLSQLTINLRQCHAVVVPR